MEGSENMFKVETEGSIGEVQIANDVVAIIAGLAAMEVKGVASMAGNVTAELISKLGMKNLSKGVSIEVEDGNVSVDLSLNLEYKYNLVDVSGKVQEKVKAAIENMTGLNVVSVNVKVASVDVQK
jgi:uncharacterized alkaline shock family protein YloU